jgi:hypothetical protein
MILCFYKIGIVRLQNGQVPNININFACQQRVFGLNFRLCSGAIAQWLEQRTHNPSVPGSSPGCPTFLIGFARLKSDFSPLTICVPFAYPN